MVAEARTWIKTPWRHMAAIKGAGVDCAMLLAAVYVATGLVKPFDPRPYPMDWMLHRDDERFLGFLLGPLDFRLKTGSGRRDDASGSGAPSLTARSSPAPRR